MNDEGKQYIWICQRVLSDYRWLTDTEAEEVLAEAIYQCYTLPYPLTYALAIWAVRYSIRKHVNFNPMYSSLNRLHEKSFVVFQPEVSESNVIDLANFRKSRKHSHSP